MMRRLHIGWVAIGWLLAISITSVLVLALSAIGIVGGVPEDESTGIGLAVAVGFMIAGFIVGLKLGAAPILHGVAMGLFSIVAWFLTNLLLGEPIGATTWRSMDFGTFLGILVLQIAAAVVGARIAVRWVRSRN